MRIGHINNSVWPNDAHLRDNGLFRLRALLLFRFGNGVYLYDFSCESLLQRGHQSVTTSGAACDGFVSPTCKYEVSEVTNKKRPKHSCMGSSSATNLRPGLHSYKLRFMEF